jgi:hypothetical protein
MARALIYLLLWPIIFAWVVASSANLSQNGLFTAIVGPLVTATTNPAKLGGGLLVIYATFFIPLLVAWCVDFALRYNRWRALYVAFVSCFSSSLGQSWAFGIAGLVSGLVCAILIGLLFPRITGSSHLAS